MTRRMIDSGMWSNENFAALPAMARLLQVGIINHADDQGRIKAHPAYLRSQIFPYDDVSIDDVRKWLQTITQNGTAIVYEVDGKEYLQLVKWWDYQSLQYASPSEYPAPGAWQDRIRYNAKGGVVLTFNWITVKGEKLDNTCDNRGNPISSTPVLPPSQPPGNPPEPPAGDINKDQIKINTTKEGDRARASVPVESPPADPPPTAAHRFQPTPNEYMPGVRRPQWNQAKRNADTFMGEAGRYGVGPQPFRMMVDAILDATGKTSLANTNGENGQRTLNQAKQCVIDLLEMQRRTVEDVQAVLDSWRNNDYRGASPPSFQQIVEHASAMDAGTHITVRGQDSSKKEFSSFADYNQWAARHDPDFKRIREGVLIKGTMIKRDAYQPAVVH